MRRDDELQFEEFLLRQQCTEANTRTMSRDHTMGMLGLVPESIRSFQSAPESSCTMKCALVVGLQGEVDVTPDSGCTREHTQAKGSAPLLVGDTWDRTRRARAQARLETAASTPAPTPHGPS